MPEELLPKSSMASFKKYLWRSLKDLNTRTRFLNRKTLKYLLKKNKKAAPYFCLYLFCFSRRFRNLRITPLEKNLFDALKGSRRLKKTWRFFRLKLR